MRIFFLSLFAVVMLGQTEAPKAPLGRVIGAVTAKEASGKNLTVRADTGADYTITLDEKTLFLRVPPGEKDLKKATKIGANDVKVGDRVMARGTVEEGRKTVPAVSVIVMTKEDLAQKQQLEREEWQTRGASGLVKSVNPQSNEIVIASRTRDGVTGVETIVVGPATTIRRYAPDSIRFSDAKPATLADLQPGDLARGRGKKSPDGARIDAEDVIFGTFRTLAGTVISVDAASNEIKLNDLETKKPVTIKLNADAQLKALPPMAAMMLARRLNPSFQGGTWDAGAAAGRGGAGGFRPGTGAPGSAPDAGTPAGGGVRRPPGVQSAGPGPASAIQDAAQRGGPAGVPGEHSRMGGSSGPGIDQILERAPAFALSDLKPGEPLIISTTARAGSPVANATTVLSGVDLILRAAPAGSVNLGSWSLDLNMPAQ